MNNAVGASGEAALDEARALIKAEATAVGLEGRDAYPPLDPDPVILPKGMISLSRFDNTSIWSLSDGG